MDWGHRRFECWFIHDGHHVWSQQGKDMDTEPRRSGESVLKLGIEMVIIPVFNLELQLLRPFGLCMHHSFCAVLGTKETLSLVMHELYIKAAL